jgi:Coenzyme PQQ synthesis protein D (PqqD)
VTRRLQRVPDVVFQELDGEVLVLAPGQTAVLHLNPTASDVWDLLATASSSEELATLLARGYGVPVEQVAADLAALLPVLLEHGVVQLAHP